MKRHMQPADEPAMQQGCERARVHHQTGGFSIDGCVNVQIISFTYANRHTVEAAILCARRFARKSGIHFEDQYLFLAVKNGASRQENISTENPIDFLFLKYAGSASKRGEEESEARSPFGAAKQISDAAKKAASKIDHVAGDKHRAGIFTRRRIAWFLPGESGFGFRCDRPIKNATAGNVWRCLILIRLINSPPAKRLRCQR